MALTYEESAALMADPVFQGRVKVACLSYAQYINYEDPASPGHNARFRWAQNMYNNPVFVAGQITPPTVMNPNVQEAGAAVTDQNLQAAVQAVVDVVA